MRKDRWSGGLLCVSCSVSSDLVGLVLLLVAPQDGLREACLPLNSGYCWRGGVGSWNLSLFIRWAPLHIPSASFWVGLLCSVPLNFWSDKQQVDITVNTFFFFESTVNTVDNTALFRTSNDESMKRASVKPNFQNNINQYLPCCSHQNLGSELHSWKYSHFTGKKVEVFWAMDATRKISRANKPN